MYKQNWGIERVVKILDMYGTRFYIELIFRTGLSVLGHMEGTGTYRTFDFEIVKIRNGEFGYSGSDDVEIIKSKLAPFENQHAIGSSYYDRPNNTYQHYNFNVGEQYQVVCRITHHDHDWKRAAAENNQMKLGLVLQNKVPVELRPNVAQLIRPLLGTPYVDLRLLDTPVAKKLIRVAEDGIDDLDARKRTKFT